MRYIRSVAIGIRDIIVYSMNTCFIEVRVARDADSSEYIRSKIRIITYIGYEIKSCECFRCPL